MLKCKRKGMSCPLMAVFSSASAVKNPGCDYGTLTLDCILGSQIYLKDLATRSRAACYSGNSCGASLVEVAVSKSPNLFVAFIFGVDKTGFPLKISMRLETRDIMVFDDPLAITRAHVLSVPTDVYCLELICHLEL